MSFLSAIKGFFGLGPKSLDLKEGDRLLPCEDCKQDFVFDAGEQRFFKEKGFSDPKRCPKCRKKVRSRMRRRGRRGRGGGDGDSGSAPAEAPRKEARHDNGGGRHGRGRHGRRRHSVIDGDSPYADER